MLSPTVPADPGIGGWIVRINVYSEELTEEVQLVSKMDERGGTHYGVRLFLASSPLLHNRPDDDDRSAITYWLSRGGAFKPDQMAAAFDMAAALCRTVTEKMSDRS